MQWQNALKRMQGNVKILKLSLGLAWLGLAWLHETKIYLYHNDLIIAYLIKMSSGIIVFKLVI